MGEFSGAITGLVINTGGTVVLDNTTANNAARILATAPITLDGGTLQVNVNSTTALTESLGAVTLGAGTSTIAVTNLGSAGSTLTFAGLTRAAASGGVLNVSGSNIGGSTGTINLVKFTKRNEQRRLAVYHD